MPALDHIRAYAAILIILYHTLNNISYQILYNKPFDFDHWIYTNNPLHAFIIEGHTAVALFMVLSGFIFTYGAYGKEINYIGFAKNRVLRIYPLFIFLIFVGICIYPQNFSFTALTQTLFGFANIQGSLNLGAFSAMFWAISVEFQFYLIFPFLFMLMKSDYKKLFYLLGLAIIFRITGTLLDANIREISYWTILGRIDQFILGMIAAKWFREMNEKKEKVFKIAFLPNLILIFLVIFLFNKLGGWVAVENWKVIWPTIEGLIWAIFIVSYTVSFNNYSNPLSKILAKIGELSFSMYLIHFVVIQIIVNKGFFFVLDISPFKNAFLNSVFIVLPITILISLLTYNLIEKPFLKLRVKYLK